ncbi:MAG: TRAP transporter substrate-binding protein DctP [Deltaproteobacteria bacterium]|nr:TRAP transporter substrate-binding protein DctP [Deltaproteobacteria bacterium]
MKISKLSKLFTAASLLLSLSLPLQAAEHEIKVSVLAPEGSTWVNIMKEMDKELQTASGGKAALKIYAGGVSGDEKDVIRKMRIGQVHAAGLTGVGLGEINPSVRVLELPMLFNSYQEADYVKSKIQGDFEKQFDAKGYVLLGWAEAGFVNIMSNKPIKSKADMVGTKWWAWEGDPLVKEMYATLGITPTPLALPDVLTSLQTNLIDAVYAPPLAAIALQWFTKTKYMTDLPLANSTGAFVMSKTEFAKLPADLQTTLKTVSEKYCTKLVAAIRADNAKSMETLKKNGIQVITVAPNDKAELEKVSAEVRPKLVGKLYSQELLNKVQGLITEYRSGHK